MSINSQQFKIGASITAVFTTGSQSPSLTSQGVTVSDLASNVDYTVLQCTGTPAVSGGNVPYVNLPPRTGNYVFVSNLTSTGSVNFQLFSGDTNVQSVSASETALLVNIGGAYKKVTLPNVTLDLSKLTAASTIPSTSKFLIQLSDGTQQSVTFATLLSQLGISSAANVLTAKAASTSNITTSGSQTVDGVSLSAGDVAFLTGQSLALNDGLYVVSSGSWQRSALYPIGTSAANYLIEVLHGSTRRALQV